VRNGGPPGAAKGAVFTLVFRRAEALSAAGA
jgi:hypothetical protein